MLKAVTKGLNIYLHFFNIYFLLVELHTSPCLCRLNIVKKHNNIKKFAQNNSFNINYQLNNSGKNMAL